MSKNREPVSYSSYLQLDKILSAQKLKSSEYDATAHDEMLFIVIHQTYELWFRQIIHELDSIMLMFQREYVDEKNIGVAVARLDRIIEIQKVLIDQVRILETMTPLDFLEFRNFLTPASGFQSFQFRAVEIRLGLQIEQRVKYSQQAYHHMFPEEARKDLLELESRPSLFELLERWLERTPFLELTGFNFMSSYQNAVEAYLQEEREAIENNSAITADDRESRLQLMQASEKHFQSIFEREKHDQLCKEGRRRLSYDATIAALFIHLYRDHPILHEPYKLLSALVDVDELISTWRYRHALMVLRMIGRKTGTGGSAGYSYLKATAESHRVFADLFNLSTFLIPRSQLPDLPENINRRLSFHFTTESTDK